jgi:phosphate uptake regulator
MSDLTARLRALFRSYAADIELNQDAVDRLCEQFSRDLGELIAEYGHAAVDKAIDDLPDGPWPSVPLH